MPTPASFWRGFLDSINEKPKNSSIVFSLLKQLRPVELNDNKIVLGCVNQGLRFFLEKRAEEIEGAIFDYSKKRFSVELIIVEQKKEESAPPLLDYRPSVSDRLREAGLYIKYSFDNFAVSSTNQVAFAAGQAVVDNLGSAYNPLFIYGGVGVGKTHLAQAVARKIVEKNNESRVFFCPGDQFTNELIESIREKATPRFRKKYRRLSLLVVDDIQFIAGKKTVQEEFFHTFNTVVSAGGQIILISDRPPTEIKDLEDRLRSRFSGGLTVDIQPPDFELRSAIVLIKAREKKIEIDIEAARVIAERVEDTRALEGALLSIYARTLGKKEKIDLETIDSFFSDKTKKQNDRVLPEDVVRAVCSYYNIKIGQVKGSSRQESYVLPRQIIMYILRSHLRLKLTDVAAFLRRKDHTTVMHADEKIRRLLTKDQIIKQEIDGIIKSLSLST